MDSIIFIALIYLLPGLIKLINKSMKAEAQKNGAVEGAKKPRKVKTKSKPKYVSRVTNKFEGFHLKMKNVADEISQESLKVSRPDVDEVIAKMESEASFNKKMVGRNVVKEVPESDAILWANKHGSKKSIRQDFGSMESIRRGIIMSEILGKPKSLKNR